MCHGLLQLREFGRWPVYFNANDIGYFEHFVQNWRDVLQMSEKPLPAFVSFAAENFVAVNTETVKDILFLGRSFIDELPQDGLDCFQFSRVRFEVRMQTDEIRPHAKNLITNRHEEPRITSNVFEGSDAKAQTITDRRRDPAPRHFRLEPNHRTRRHRDHDISSISLSTSRA